MDVKEFDHLQCSYVKCILQSLLLSIIHVSSLHVWKFKHSSDHPSTIKKRFVSVLFMLIFSPLYIWFVLHDKTEIPIWYCFGLKWDGMFVSVIYSVALTSIIFLGPICLYCLEEIDLTSINSTENMKSNLTDIIWLKNYVVAPVSEEFTFRACIIPLLLQCFQPETTIFISALFFGAAHFSHWIERIRTGKPCIKALFKTVFQVVYSTIFGAYSALLFIYTGNIIAPIIAHTFCNHMGFPDFRKMFQLPEPRRSCIFVLTSTGLVLWLVVIKYVSRPWIYSNHIDWTEINQC